MKPNVQLAIKKNAPAVVLGVVCLAISVSILLFPNTQKATSFVNLSEYSSINTICELATLKSFYHNVVMYEQEPNGGNKFVNDVLFWPFGKYTNVGYKQFWLEYSGIVEIGIDASQIKISEPNETNVVDIYIPNAKVLNVYADESSLTEPLTENGWFTSITGEEKASAFAAAQRAMREEAEEDQSLLAHATANAKLLLEQYIVSIGKETGVDLTVNWIDKP